MVLRSTLAAAFVAGVFMNAACGGSNEPPPPDQHQPPVFKPIELPPPATTGETPSSSGPAAGTAFPAAPFTAGEIGPVAMVTDMASGWPVTLRVGQEMTARLAVNRESGSRWTLRPATDGGVVLRLGEPTYEKAASGGMEVFRLKAVKPGTTTLTFDQKVGTSATPGKSVSYPVTVQ